MRFQLHQGDCLEILRGMPDCSIDSVVCDPPYGLSFMGKRWDYDVPSVEIWAECLRVLKPGGHLLAFAGTRTQHRMAVRIEDAGFEIRDMIAWVYGSGFPKSLDVSKALEAYAKTGRSDSQVTGDGRSRVPGQHFKEFRRGNAPKADFTPTTDAARQWQGWGTALKPALETVTFASKPYTDKQLLDIIQSNLIRLEARLWLLSTVSAAQKSSTSSQSEYDAACAIAQWSADEITSTRGALCDPMGTSLFELATTTSLSIVSSWRLTLGESWSDGNTSTIETRSSKTIDWRTLKFSLSRITPESIIKACSLPGGFSANASTAESHFNASLSLLQSILTLSATERAMSQAQHEHQGVGVKPNLDPCIMARKPLTGTVAENVLAHGTGALNIDGCRVSANGESLARPFGSGGISAAQLNAIPRGTITGENLTGRWPANLIHDGSEEVLAGFPDGAKPKRARSGRRGGRGFGDFDHEKSARTEGYWPADPGGSAARFFYCAKASKANRGADNVHPTVKPTDLMRYLCRLVTPPKGVVLDPFTGSGSTGKAAILEGFKFIGCELSEEYIAIARARIEAACAQDDKQQDLFA